MNIIKNQYKRTIKKFMTTFFLFIFIVLTSCSDERSKVDGFIGIAQGCLNSADAVINDKQEWVNNEFNKVDVLQIKTEKIHDIESITCDVENTYDESGNLIEKIEYTDSGLYEIVIYTYDEEGNEIEKETKKPDGSLGSRTTSQYNEYGDVTYRKYEYSYRNQRKTEETTYSYQYDANGNITEKEINNVTLGTGWTIQYEFDSQNNVISETEYSSSFGMDHKRTFRYDSQGNMVEEKYDTDLMGQVLPYTYTYRYNEAGNLIEFDDGYCVDTMEYDSTGKIIKKENMSKGGGINSSVVYEYKYDANGNLVGEYGTRDDGVLVYSREISYFN